MRRFGIVGVLALVIQVSCLMAPLPRPPVHQAIIHQTLHVVRQTASDLEDVELQATREHLQTATAERDKAQTQLKDLQTQEQQLLAQVADLKAQLADFRSGLGAGPGTVAPGNVANHFPWGWCTWYVASRRSVPWFGNAIEWPVNALSYGMAEGAVPRVGAIMVSAESIWGHVAYVEAVYSDGSFRVEEMNWTAWGVVDSRIVFPNRVPVRGFIY